MRPARTATGNSWAVSNCSLTTCASVSAPLLEVSENLSDLVAPSFPGAACRDHADLFDLAAGGAGRSGSPEIAHAREAALAVCAGCPVIRPCRAYFGSLKPSQRPPGITGGMLNVTRGAHTPW